MLLRGSIFLYSDGTAHDVGILCLGKASKGRQEGDGYGTAELLT